MFDHHNVLQCTHIISITISIGHIQDQGYLLGITFKIHILVQNVLVFFFGEKVPFLNTKLDIFL
jgi:hypothetical protein